MVIHFDVFNCSEYSRCGRTDKGVSALGNVMALKLRCKKTDDKEKTDIQTDFDYVKMINGCLPADIRVLSTADVPDNFNARYLIDFDKYHKRYDCKLRIYKYLFLKGDLNIKKMQNAAVNFMGEHDFRNFCKLNITDTITYK
jgi:tRNA pseudouridine38/39 synthase